MDDPVFSVFSMCSCVLFGAMLEQDDVRGSTLSSTFLLIALIGLVISGVVLVGRLVVGWLS